jgi:hypothetical protein
MQSQAFIHLFIDEISDFKAGLALGFSVQIEKKNEIK